jgi:hypothetical protein
VPFSPKDAEPTLANCPRLIHLVPYRVISLIFQFSRVLAEDAQRSKNTDTEMKYAYTNVWLFLMGYYRNPDTVLYV